MALWRWQVVVKIIANAYWAPPYIKDVDTAGYTGDLYITNYRLALFVPTFAFSAVRRFPSFPALLLLRRRSRSRPRIACMCGGRM